MEKKLAGPGLGGFFLPARTRKQWDEYRSKHPIAPSCKHPIATSTDASLQIQFMEIRGQIVQLRVALGAVVLFAVSFLVVSIVSQLRALPLLVFLGHWTYIFFKDRTKLKKVIDCICPECGGIPQTKRVSPTSWVVACSCERKSAPVTDGRYR